MSVRKRRIVLKPQARDDLHGALLQTRRQWGAGQRVRYKSLLYEAMRGLVDYPERGRTRDELFRGCRSLPAGEHVLYYHVTDDEAVIVRVLHGRQDAEAKVPGSAW